MTDYKLLCLSLRSLIENVPHPVADLANASALLWDTLEDINWAGFYLMEGDTLVLGPFQGKPACIEIGPGKGVCGAAASENRTQLVADVVVDGAEGTGREFAGICGRAGQQQEEDGKDSFHRRKDTKTAAIIRAAARCR